MAMTEEFNLAAEITKLAKIISQEALSDCFRNQAETASSSFEQENLDGVTYYPHHPTPLEIQAARRPAYRMRSLWIGFQRRCATRFGARFQTGADLTVEGAAGLLSATSPTITAPAPVAALSSRAALTVGIALSARVAPPD